LSPPFVIPAEEEGIVLPVMAYMGRLSLKKYLFQAWSILKGRDFTS